MRHKISDDYFIVSENYKNVNYIVSYDDERDFEILSSIPIEKRIIFKPSEDSMTYLFHKSFINNVLNGGALQSGKVISASQWTMEWMLS